MATMLLVARKDLRLRLRDRSVVLVGLVVPLGLAWVFSLILADVTSGGLQLTVAVADPDDVLAPATGAGLFEVVAAADGQEVADLVAREEASAGLVVPPGFLDAVAAGRPASLEVVTRPGAPTSGRMTQAIAEGFAAELTYAQVAVATALAAGAAADPPVLAEQAGGEPWPVALAALQAGRQEMEPATYLSAGMAVFFLFFAVQAGITGIIEEREHGTLARLLAAPVPRAAVYAGKLLTSLLIGLLSMTALVVATTLLLGADWGHPGGVALLVVAGVLAAVAIQAVIGTIARTSEQAGVWQSIVAIVLGMLGGAFFQVSLGPALLARVSLATPHAWFLRGLGDLRAGEGAGAVLPEAGVLMLFAVVAGAVALLRLRRLAQQ